MSWSAAQRARLASEKSILEKYFPGRVTWIDPQGSTKVEVAMTTTDGNNYRLRVHLKPDFPNSIPDMVVSYSEERMPDWVSSSVTHTWGKDRYGQLEICHCRPRHWTDKFSLFEVFIKGRIWLEAYECWRRTGMTMDNLLSGTRK